MDNKKIMSLYISKQLNRDLTKYIIDNDLDLEKITVNKLIANIISEWINEPTLDKRNIIKSGKKDEDGELCRRLNISLDEDKLILLNRIHMERYIYQASTKNGLALNIVNQWARNNLKFVN